MPYKEHPELAKGHAVIILTDDAGSLRDQEQGAWLEEHIGQPRGFFLGAASLFLGICRGRGEREREHHHQFAGAERLRARQLAAGLCCGGDRWSAGASRVRTLGPQGEIGPDHPRGLRPGPDTARRAAHRLLGAELVAGRRPAYADRPCHAIGPHRLAQRHHE